MTYLDFEIFFFENISQFSWVVDFFNTGSIEITGLITTREM